MKTEELIEQLGRAKKSGKLMVAVWYLEGDQLILFRQTENFQLSDIPLALKQLEDDLKPITLEEEEA